VRRGNELVDAQEEARLVGRGELGIGPVADVGEALGTGRTGDGAQPGTADPGVDRAGRVVVGDRDHATQQVALAGVEVPASRAPQHRHHEHCLDHARRREPRRAPQPAQPAVPVEHGEGHRSGPRARVADRRRDPGGGRQHRRDPSSVGNHGAGGRRMNERERQRGEDDGMSGSWADARDPTARR
jgi:hypothetical protein